jgi:hypothetical protein
MRSFACHRSVARVCFSTGSGAKWLSNRYAPLKRKSPTCIATAISAPRRVRFGLALASFKTSSAFVIEAPGQPKPRRGITGVPVPLPFSALRPLPRHQAADHVLKVAPVGGRRPAADRSRGTPLALGRLRPVSAQLLHAGADRVKILGSARARGSGAHCMESRQLGDTATDWKIMVNEARCVVLPRSSAFNGPPTRS